VERVKLENFEYRYTALFEQEKAGAGAGVGPAKAVRVRGGYFCAPSRRRR
jgi:hypothetical protein